MVGFAIPALEVTGKLRRTVTGLFIAGQWGLPGVIWIGEGLGLTLLLPTIFLWGGALITSMLILLYLTVTQPSSIAGSGPTGAAPAND